MSRDSSAPVALVDTSGSMAFYDTDAKRRIDLLADVLGTVLASTRGLRIVHFNSAADELVGLEPGPNLKLPEPVGSTALHRGLAWIVEHGLRPSRIIVITDGAVDDPSGALSHARALAPVTIDAFYVGPDGNASALGFLRALTFAGGRPGVSGPRRLAKPEKLADEIVLRLSGPAR